MLYSSHHNIKPNDNFPSILRQPYPPQRGEPNKTHPLSPSVNANPITNPMNALTIRRDKHRPAEQDKIVQEKKPNTPTRHPNARNARQAPRRPTDPVQATECGSTHNARHAIVVVVVATPQVAPKRPNSRPNPAHLRMQPAKTASHIHRGSGWSSQNQIQKVAPKQTRLKRGSTSATSAAQACSADSSSSPSSSSGWGYRAAAGRRQARGGG